MTCTEQELFDRIEWMRTQGVEFGCLSLGLPYAEGNHDRAITLLKEGNEDSRPVLRVRARSVNPDLGYDRKMITFDVHEDHAVDFALRWQTEIVGRPPSMARFMDILNRDDK